MLTLVLWSAALVLVFWLPFDGHLDRGPDRLERFEWIPFVDYFENNYVAAYNRILNKLVLIVPVGFFLARARPGSYWNGWVCGGTLSLIVELGQVAWTMHRASTSDVVIGAIGGGLGTILANRVARLPLPEPIQQSELILSGSGRSWPANGRSEPRTDRNGAHCS